MPILNFTKRVFRSYSYVDWILTSFGIILVLLMVLKMMVFPYGFGLFSSTNIYTEAIVSKTGFQNINPLYVDYNEADREVSRLVFSGLMKYDIDSRRVVEDMGLLTISEDKKEYTLTLKDGLKWQDGQNLTIDDVYFTYHDIIMDERFPNQILKANFSGVGLQLVGNSVKFTLEKPNSFFISNLVYGILPKHILNGVDPASLLEHSFNKFPVGSGPYAMKEPLESFVDGRMQVNLKENEYYYGPSSDVEVLRIIAFEDMEILFEDLNSINAIVKVTGWNISEFENNDRFSILSYELPQYIAVFMNMESEFLRSDGVRLALQKSIDKTKLLDEFVDKKPVDTPLMQLDQENWEYKTNIGEAMGSLKDAGFSYAEDDTEKSGFRFNDGKALELKLITRSYPQGGQQYVETQKIIAFLQLAWKDIGVNLLVEFYDMDEFEDKIMQRDYDLLLVGQSLGYNLDTYSYWHSTQATPTGQNFSNYKSFAVDTLIEDIRGLFDEEKRQEKLNALATQIREDFPAIFLYRPVYYYVTDGKILGLNMEGVVFPSDRYANIANWKFDK